MKDKMRVLIVNPPPTGGKKFIREGRCEQRLSSFQYVMVPISLPSIAAVLREAGHQVKLVDCVAQDIPLKNLIELVLTFHPGLVLFNFSTVTYEGDKETVRVLREVSQAHFTAIGVHVTALPETTLKETSLNSVTRGEPEETVLALAEALKAGSSLEEVKGISFKDGGEVINNPPRDFIKNLDSLPFPSRDLLDNKKYTMPISNRPYTLIITSRGCSHSCIFCTAHCYYGKRLRKRSASNIVDEMEEVVERYKIKDMTMWSDTFTLDRQFVLDVCSEIEKRDLKVNWMCNSRVDTVDFEMLSRMAETGCTVMSYGVESGVQEILDRAKKRITVEQIRDAFKWTRQAGIESIAHVILGLPGETPQTIKKTIALVNQIQPDYAQYYCAIPFPGTELYEQAVKEGWLITKDWSKFEINQAIISTPNLSAKELNQARQIAFRQFYLRPSYMWKRLRGAKSLKEVANLALEGFDFLRSWAMSS